MFNNDIFFRKSLFFEKLFDQKRMGLVDLNLSLTEVNVKIGKLTFQKMFILTELMNLSSIIHSIVT